MSVRRTIEYGPYAELGRDAVARSRRTIHSATPSAITPWAMTPYRRALLASGWLIGVMNQFPACAATLNSIPATIPE
jgi:hypothetical protein